MEYVADGGVFPYTDFFIRDLTCEETSVGGEGHFRWRIPTYKIEKEPGIWGIPYQDCPFEDEGEEGESRKEQEFA